MHTFRHFNLNSFLPERLVYAGSPENSSEAETPKFETEKTTEATDNPEDMTEITEREGERAVRKLEREAKRAERREEVDSEFKDAVENLIKLQGDGKYNILLEGEWVPATVDNRLARQRGIWERQEGAKGGDTNQFMNQERYAEGKKEERRKRYADRNEDKDAFKQGEKERRKDEAQLWALQAGWEFKRPFKEITKSKKEGSEEQDTLAQGPEQEVPNPNLTSETEGNEIGETNSTTPELQDVILMDGEPEALKNYLLAHSELGTLPTNFDFNAFKGKVAKNLSNLPAFFEFNNELFENEAFQQLLSAELQISKPAEEPKKRQNLKSKLEDFKPQGFESDLNFLVELMDTHMIYVELVPSYEGREELQNALLAFVRVHKEKINALPPKERAEFNSKLAYTLSVNVPFTEDDKDRVYLSQETFKASNRTLDYCEKAMTDLFSLTPEGSENINRYEVTELKLIHKSLGELYGFLHLSDGRSEWGKGSLRPPKALLERLANTSSKLKEYEERQNKLVESGEKYILNDIEAKLGIRGENPRERDVLLGFYKEKAGKKESLNYQDTQDLLRLYRISKLSPEDYMIRRSEVLKALDSPTESKATEAEVGSLINFMLEENIRTTNETVMKSRLAKLRS